MLLFFYSNIRSMNKSPPSKHENSSGHFVAKSCNLLLFVSFPKEMLDSYDGNCVHIDKVMCRCSIMKSKLLQKRWGNLILSCCNIVTGVASNWHLPFAFGNTKNAGRVLKTTNLMWMSENKMYTGS